MSAGVFPFAGIFTQDAGHEPAHKPDFALVPQQVCDDLCRLAGARAITQARKASGGVSASAAFLLTFDTGETLFVKGSHPGDQSHGAANLRGECMAWRSLEVLQDLAPAFRGMVHLDRGDDNGWWLGAWSAVTDIAPRVIDAAGADAMLATIAAYTVPDSAGLPVAVAHPYLSQFMTDAYKWKRLRDDHARAEKFIACFADRSAAAAWLRGHAGFFCAQQELAAQHAWQLGFMHGDLRCDNILYGALAGQPPRWWVIDWANAAEGPLAFDRVMLAASLHAQGRLDAAQACQLAAGHGARTDMALMLVQQAGYFADQIYRAAPPALPRLRPVQRAMFWALAGMLAHEAGTAPPPEMSPHVSL